MKKTVVGLAVTALLGAAFAPMTAATDADAAAKRYANCTALNKVYKYGVRKSSSTKNVVSKRKVTSKAYVNKSLYLANTKLDRDKDGIACER